MNILVLGGTRYFGKRLVELLLRRDHHVTVATRGLSADPFGDSFGDRLERRIVDRSEPKSLAALAKGRDWDVVVDQICYSPNEAQAALDAFGGRAGRWIHTSTASVYRTHGLRPESDFDPLSHPLKMGDRADFDYGEGKRQAEAVYFQNSAPMPIAAMRIPIVLGPDDYTGRLEFHVDRVRAGRRIVVPNLEAATSFVHSDEAARFLGWLAEGAVTGPINACSEGRASIREILALIERRLSKTAVLASSGSDEDSTPFVDDKSRFLDTTRAKSLGFRFDELQSWLPGLVDTLCARAESAAP